MKPSVSSFFAEVTAPLTLPGDQKRFEEQQDARRRRMHREGVAPPQEGKVGAARREEAPAGKSGMVTRKDSSQIRIV